MPKTRNPKRTDAPSADGPEPTGPFVPIAPLFPEIRSWLMDKHQGAHFKETELENLKEGDVTYVEYKLEFEDDSNSNSDAVVEDWMLLGKVICTTTQPSPRVRIHFADLGAEPMCGLARDEQPWDDFIHGKDVHRFFVHTDKSSAPERTLPVAFSADLREKLEAEAMRALQDDFTIKRADSANRQRRAEMIAQAALKVLQIGPSDDDFEQTAQDALSESMATFQDCDKVLAANSPDEARTYCYGRANLPPLKTAYKAILAMTDQSPEKPHSEPDQINATAVGPNESLGRTHTDPHQDVCRQRDQREQPHRSSTTRHRRRPLHEGKRSLRHPAGRRDDKNVRR